MPGLDLQDVAPEGAMWWCPECGRIAGDRYGVLATRQGWSDDCTRQAVLVLASTMMVEADGRVREADLLNDQLPPMTSDTGLPH